MKIVLSLMFVLVLAKECNQNKNQDMQAKEAIERGAVSDEDITNISYEALSRGFYEKIWVENDSITVTSNRDHKIVRRYSTPEKDWNELMDLLKDLNIDGMTDLEAPTSKRLYDGAAIATLAVLKGKQETKSNSFDHGHPPQAIEAIVNKVISMKETYEKN